MRIPPEVDVLVLGAGAAGLFCAIHAARRGRETLVLDHARRPAEKVRISGGGRCNFTNVHTGPANFISANPRFCVSALSRYSPSDFISLVEAHRIAYHEKAHGQLFCDDSSQRIVNMLLSECREAHAEVLLATTIGGITKPDDRFRVETSAGTFSCTSLVVASGGLSIPKMGATNLGYRIARDFGISIVPTRAALVPFTFTEQELDSWHDLAGVAVDAAVCFDKQSFREGMLFTHRGVSGPAMLQISSYWEPGKPLRVNLSPERDVTALLHAGKSARLKQEAATLLSTVLPKRLAQRIATQQLGPRATRNLAELPQREILQLGAAVNDWMLVPSGTEGYRTAEVTLGGVDTNGLSSKTMESQRIPGLYFIGEVVDVTGHLGGFNFQWAWASAYAAAQYV